MPGSCFLLGATGATGRRLLEGLLDRGWDVTALVRSADRLPEALRANARLHAVEGAILDLDAPALRALVRNHDAMACCLGHNPTLRGMFGPPHRLVYDSVRRLHAAVAANAPAEPARLVLMGTSGHFDDGEHPALRDRLVLGPLRRLLPPVADNEAAARYLRRGVGTADPALRWTVVRPDGLVDAEAVTPYRLEPSAERSPIFGAGQVSRVNVADAMARLIDEPETWTRWEGRMPLVYAA